ncbi:MAG: outer membrane protein assembly factor BamD [Saprospiraceae bacterium]|nr:outer membrane protein assembly factor BamD [Saprospiraceae bacterium]
MKINLIKLLFGLAFLLSVASCKSEFEKIRVSNDAALILEKANVYFDQKDYQKAQTLYELLIPTYRGKKELEQIYYRYAYTYYHLGSYISAGVYFDNFASTFPTSSLREEIDFMSAYSNYQLSPTFRLDQQYTLTAIDKLQLYVNTYPSSERLKEANQLMDELRSKLEEKALEEGKLYYDVRQYQSSIQSLENVMKDFPDTKNAELIRYQIVMAAYDLAQNSIIEKQKERYEQVLAKSTIFLAKYPKSGYYNEVNAINKRAEQQLKLIQKDDRYQVQSSNY